ncbi:unnamed protein product [Rhizophagus irregularis]|uniref:Uncharacterized protein n=1 Tax=Rhizophagus irregularis TaxID=588596 RepID=A0A2I1H5J5_9GLOM|nr:hypothetical protein RhiirA4_472767 [Rhizophagus irregularis]CAB4405336.1 unnamed protein product [Rhizophagus irregularis]
MICNTNSCIFIGESKRNPTRSKKKQKIPKLRKITKETNDIGSDLDHDNMSNSLDNMDYNFTSDILENTMPVFPEYIISNSQKLIVPDFQEYINHEQQNNSNTYLKQHSVNSNDKKQQSKVLSNSNTNIIQKQNLKLNDFNENYNTNKLSNNKQTNNSDENKNSE